MFQIKLTLIYFFNKNKMYQISIWKQTLYWMLNAFKHVYMSDKLPRTCSCLRKGYVHIMKILNSTIQIIEMLHILLNMRCNADKRTKDLSWLYFTTVKGLRGGKSWSEEGRTVVQSISRKYELLLYLVIFTSRPNRQSEYGVALC